MTTVFANKALLASGWEDNVRLSIRDGQFEAIEIAVAADGRMLRSVS